MSKLFAKWLSLALVFVMVLCSGCTGDVTDAGTGKEIEVETGNTIVAILNGEEITRDMVGSSLLDAEKEVIQTYIYEKLLAEFFAGIEVTDEELEIQFEILKTQIGEESWPLYLAYYGGGSEEAFRVMLRQSLKQEKYIGSVSETLTITDEELQAAYDAKPDAYNIAVLDVVFLTTEDNYATALALYNAGATLEEIATALGTEVAEDEHTYYISDSLKWSAAWEDVSIGDILYTSEDSGSWVIGRLVAKHEGLEDEMVREQLEEELLYELSYAQTEKDYAAFLDKQVCSIMGSDFDLYVEEGTEG